MSFDRTDTISVADPDPDPVVSGLFKSPGSGTEFLKPDTDPNKNGPDPQH